MSDDRRAETGSPLGVTPPLGELLEINERLLLAGLREQAQAMEARRLAAAFEQRALHDPLTGLPNRALFEDRLEQALLVAGRERTTFTVLFLDLDRFKAINDRLGHHAGDLLLLGVAARLRDTLRETDTVARLHGDEFAVLLPGDDAVAAAGVAQKILRALAPPFFFSDQLEQIAASIGIAAYPAHGRDAAALMVRADTAMYAAKRARCGYVVAGRGAGRESPQQAGGVPDRAIPPEGPAPAREQLQAVNERLLLAGLRDRELADQLRRQLAFASAVADNLGEGVCALDRAGRITFVNPAAERLLGWIARDLLGREWGAVMPGYRAADTPLLAAVRTGVAYRDDDTLLARRDGSPIGAAVYAAPIGTGEGAVGAVVVFRDITERRRAAANSAALLARVEAALAFRTRFLEITAHELKSPLASLKGYAQLLLRHAQRGGDDQLLRALATIDHQVDHMTRLLDDLGDVARMERDGRSLDPRPLDLRALLEETVAAIGMTAPDFALRLDASVGAIWVRGDRPRLRQVLTNLLTNAIKYSDQRREADIALRREGDQAIITIADHGIGIPAAQQAAVFAPYVRATNATTGTYSGLGLGLFISKVIVDHHGGTLALVSEEGRGSTFSLALPLLPIADSVGDEDSTHSPLLP